MKSATSNLASTSGRLPAPLPTAPFAAYRAATQLSQSHTPRVILTLASGGEQAGASSTASVFSVKQLRASVPPAPPPIPVSEHQRRRKLKDAEEIAAAGRKLGLDPQRLKANLEQIDALVPDLVNLHKMKASALTAVCACFEIILLYVVRELEQLSCRIFCFLPHLAWMPLSDVCCIIVHITFSPDIAMPFSTSSCRYINYSVAGIRMGGHRVRRKGRRYQVSDAESLLTFYLQFAIKYTTCLVAGIRMGRRGERHQRRRGQAGDAQSLLPRG